MAQIATTGAGKAPATIENMSDHAAAGRRIAAEQVVGSIGESADRAAASAKAAAPSLVAAVERQAAEGTAKAHQTFVALAGEQARHNLDAMKALAGAFDWGRVLQIQAEYLRSSLDRSVQLTRRLMEAGRTASATQRQAHRRP